MDVLKMGSKGEAVKDLQTLLNKASKIDLVTDGDFGKVTLNAVIMFQSKHGIKMTGVVDDQTYAAIKAAADVDSAVAQATAPAPVAEAATEPVTPGKVLVTVGLLKRIFPKLDAEKYVDSINASLARFHIDTPKRMACFFANVDAESRGLTVLSENLNYSAAGLAATWSRLYSFNNAPNALALALAKRPEQIANRTYANINGNGSVESGDGWKFRGRGPSMVTFRNNYKAYGEKLGLDLLSNPDLVATVEVGFLVSCCHWAENNINRYADALDFDGVCDMINIGRKTTKYGDAIGFLDRNASFKRIRTYFSI